MAPPPLSWRRPGRGPARVRHLVGPIGWPRAKDKRRTVRKQRVHVESHKLVISRQRGTNGSGTGATESVTLLDQISQRQGADGKTICIWYHTKGA